jgi:hypothetical protein
MEQKMDISDIFIIGCFAVAVCSFSIVIISEVLDKRRLLRARKALDLKLAELNAAENVLRVFSPKPLAEDILTYFNSLGAKNMTQLLQKLVLQERDSYAQRLMECLERDVLNNRWVLPFDITGVEESLQDEKRTQYTIWTYRRANLRRECSNLQVALDELEEKLRPKTTPADDAASPNPDDKRAELKRLRVDITGNRLKAERLEKEILDEEGADIPNRRADGVPTDE